MFRSGICYTVSYRSPSLPCILCYSLSDQGSSLIISQKMWLTYFQAQFAQKHSSRPYSLLHRLFSSYRSPPSSPYIQHYLLAAPEYQDRLRESHNQVLTTLPTNTRPPPSQFRDEFISSENK